MSDVVLRAWLSPRGYQAWAYCPFCRHMHFHGARSGDRASHCRPDVADAPTGYWIEIEGQVTEEILMSLDICLRQRRELIQDVRDARRESKSSRSEMVSAVGR